MSDSNSDPAPRYACHCTFTVSATLRRSIGLDATYANTLAHASPRRSVSRIRVPRSRRRTAYPPAPMVSSHTTAAGSTPAGRFTASVAGTVGWSQVDAAACARACARASSGVAV